MFQPETEDMLPRMAPKPIPDVISGSGEAIIRPQVPEVSILFGQQDANYQQQIFKNPLQTKDFPKQTYAAWKKQMLPKVTYPAHTNIPDTQLPENNIVMTGYNCTTTNINPLPLNVSPALNVGSNVNVFRGSNGSAEAVNPLTYRRSLENCNNNYYQPVQTFSVLPSQTPMGTLQHKLNQLPNSSTKEILTICAGTQTDAFQQANNVCIPAESLSNLATKKDIENICHFLAELRDEQQRLLKILETIAFSQHTQITKEIHCRDVSVQTDADNSSNLNGDIASSEKHQPVPKNKFLDQIKPNNIQQPPKGKQAAQSTAYRINSPQIKNFRYDAPAYQETNKPIEMIPKSASDTSLAMSELALKYLPNEKLAELLKELNMECPTITAKELERKTLNNRDNFDKFGKSPSDISNASYKYLKKYRLLPEDHTESRKNADEGAMQNNIENQTPKYNSPQYNMQNSTNNQRQTPTNKCSPYAADRLPLSPLARAAPSCLPSTVPQHIVDLDNIRQQPKFL